MKNNQLQKMAHQYRADIDGLRAIAVLSVVGFHMFPEWVTGGFIGVDIFFVISGYLITSMILADLQSNSFSLIDFYTRRINRIFPALILVLLFVLIAGWYLLAQEKYKELNQHITWAAAFIYNFLLLNDGGYFSAAAESRPLLHLWSLSIEEQFYIVWPILLIASWKFKKWRGVIVLAMIAVATSFITSIATDNKIVAFYSPISRCWELLVGACLAYGVIQHSVDDDKLKNAQSVVGALLLVSGLVLINKSSAFPGWWALLPTVGSALLISAGCNAWLNKNILSSKLFVWIGLISYPLYLWHWPLLSFFRLFNGEALSVVSRIILILISILLAAVTYLLIEKRMRQNKLRKLKTIILLVLMVTIGTTCLLTYRGYLVGSQENMLANLKAQGNHDTAACWEKWLKYVRFDSCYLHDIHQLKRPAVCYEEQKPSIAIWGDSHAAALYPGFKKLGIDKKFGIIEVSQAGCPPIFDLGEKNITFRKNCNEVNQDVFKSLIEIKPDVLVLHAAWKVDIYTLSNDELSTKFGKTLKQVKKALPNTKIVVLGPVPRWDTSPEQVAYLDALKSGSSQFPVKQKATQLDELDAILQKNAADAGVDFISANKVLCDEEGCISKVVEDQQSDYIACDYGHFTETGSQFFVDRIKSDLLPGRMKF